MKITARFLSTTLVLVLCASSISFAASDPASFTSQKEKILVQEDQITDKDLLLDRAKRGITDDKDSNFKFKLEGDTVNVVDEYQTTQLLEKTSVGDEIISDYAATGIIELNVEPEDTSKEAIAKVCASAKDCGSIFFTKSGESKQLIATDSQIGDDHMTTHVLVYNTIYYTNTTKTDYLGKTSKCSTFTKATGKLTTYDGASFSNAKVKLYAAGQEIISGKLITPTTAVSLGTASSYTKATGFTAMFRELGTVDAPVYSIKTTIPWTRSGESGTSVCTYVYVLGDVDGTWFDD